MSDSESEPGREPGREMVKADKTTVHRRVHEVLRVLLLGGEFDDVKQYASAQCWGVGDRQLRRYIERAYSDLAKHTQRDQKQLLGRHILQRRALYARAIKGNDIRTALHVLKDEAALQGLYEYAIQELASSGSNHSSIPRRERFKRLLLARQKDDQKEVTLIEESSPTLGYIMPDTRMSETMLYTMASVYAAEQLDHAAMVLLALWRLSLNDERSEFWEQMATIHAWTFSVEREGWELFGKELGICPESLIASSHRGSFLDLFSDQLDALSPDRAEVEQLLATMGQSADRLSTPQTVARRWRRMLEEVLDK